MKNGIPSDGEVADAVRSAMTKKPRIESQRELSDLVRAELASRLGTGVRVTSDRIRRVALSSGSARVEIEYRETAKTGLPEFCPVCRSAMSPVMNMNLDGELTEVKRNCTLCSYSVVNRIRVPGRYVFVRTASGEVSDREERIRKLQKAAAHLRTAKRLIAEALYGTDLEGRKGFSEEMIDCMTSSKRSAGSIRNLLADMKNESRENPLWTDPLRTPKYPDRKSL